MAALAATAERFEFRVKFLFVLIFFLYVGLFFNFYYTFHISNLCSQRQGSSSFFSADQLYIQTSDPQIEPTPTDIFVGEVDDERGRANEIAQNSRKGSQESHSFKDIKHYISRYLRKKRPEDTKDVTMKGRIKKQWNNFSLKTSLHSSQASSIRVKRHAKPRRQRHRRRHLRYNDAPSVEFFPMLQSTTATGHYVWLTPHSRIAFPILEDFCLSARKFCVLNFPRPTTYSGKRGLSEKQRLQKPQDVYGITASNTPKALPDLQGKKGESGTPVPPKIVDIENTSILEVHEGDNVYLQCLASGNPVPKLIWKREDSEFIVLGNIKLKMVEGDHLNIIRATRYDMGSYLCVASNGVAPPDSKKIQLEITFSPVVKIMNPMVGVRIRNFAVFECYVEAFPRPMNYWLYGGTKFLDPSWKYNITEVINHFSYKMILNITYAERQDLGIYKCVSRNLKGLAHGMLTLYEIDHVTEEPKGKHTLNKKAENLSTVNVTSNDSRFNDSYWWVLQPRVKDCLLYKVGKPVFQRFSNSTWGCWMKDAAPSNVEQANKYWLTLQNKKNTLYEFTNKDFFRNNSYTKSYTLPYALTGNNHVVFNGSFYYNREGTNSLVRFNLLTATNSTVQIPHAAYKDGHYLYSSQHSYMDLAADENGMWIIFAGNNTKNTLVLKYHPYTLQTEKMWNLTLDHRGIGETFIACGVLYAISSVTALKTRISYAYDLYCNKTLDINLDFINPFGRTTMVSYNAKEEVIYTWDRGNQLLYPVRFATTNMAKSDLKRNKKYSRT
ncbi:uncharacterized protein LOC111085528 [Limulus polyphemus]|uniref:Uncharacterized protein LOC111085528 n=1 Tax=Limulus polyphemus TaxID=6850 RepID=A0ABM1S9C5_LIMPO|nr:uncharacterized protein LOC111085528 [Limulus polyphemus]